ncbi:hypothetical protein ATANTOWER_024621, partial [Ataeniobius toweri]|nr:hypothetical protein [Ataeniobius toweri]
MWPGVLSICRADGFRLFLLQADLLLTAGLGTPLAPPGGAGGGVWGEGHLGVSAESAAPTTRSRISGRRRVRVRVT